jgi:DNA-binding XRE family transcriptional regulator
MTNQTFRYIRLYLKMGQTEFAEYLEIGRPSVYLIESGDRKVSDKVRSKVAHKFEPTDDFYEFVERMRKLEEPL